MDEDVLEDLWKRLLDEVETGLSRTDVTDNDGDDGSGDI
jgi:hypothetical protein